MEDKHSYIDDLFRKELGGYREEPAPAVWSKLEQRLDGRRKRRVIIWWMTGLALLLAASTLWLSGAIAPCASVPYMAAGKQPVAAPVHSNKAIPATTQTAAIATPKPAPLTPAKAQTQKQQVRRLPVQPVLAQQAPAIETPAKTTQTTQTTTTNNKADDVILTQTNNIPATTAMQMQATDNTPAVAVSQPVSIPTATPPAEDILASMPLPTAGAPKKQIQTDISQYEPLITRSKRQGESMIASANKQMAPVESKPIAYNTAAPSPAKAIAIPVETIPATPAQQVSETTAANEVAAPAAAPAVTDAPRHRVTWDYGVKMGFEASTNKYHAGNGIVGVYAQANITKRIALLMQPTIKYGWMKQTTLDDAKPYYDVKNNNTTALHIITPDGLDGNGNPVYNIIRRYFYAQQYDSVSVSKTIRPKQYFEFELPLLVQYKLTKQFSVSAGISANISRLVQVERDELRFAGKMRYDTLVFAAVNESSPVPPVPGIETRIKYNYAPYADFMANEKLNADGNPIRINYMLGLNYALKNGISFDLLMLSMLNSAAYIPDERVRSIYKRPYIRVGVGYKLNNK
ncbi:hypothetical protein CAP35_13300 [Chitinophagaceae bacterium IBVUCB1]|nr:hypothetical protein CAP35_13300 [Chitinophagaceae bacterium IBVUCB1]